MQTKAKIALFCTAVLLIAAAVFGSMFALDRARTEKAKYIESEEKLALIDLCHALNENGFRLPLTQLDAKECAQALYDVLKA